ncbi:unnamed protein product [Tilletia controversa]|uniref:NADH-ubiquinone oxidoreductase 21kDa subunit N-terminal domain-containing protein n=3 Tax=Tilletia TaxID=13289 RepID=A0A8X7T0W4_9BASI|nr:hypothetical protein CF336_g365 [Tilletia laevis]KAE8205271.1 hypothetical protein CF328_g596 [Tilletia controversa]KAE8264888.1 hypothetical protein A4X03_0g630 [Tilletia caries]KAE8208560.1 hypothetical protein CF335_g323 [Tilletia laevis]KAE8254870.1 hypothetical protein A4X06_0g697 [Tilletia controversa]
MPIIKEVAHPFPLIDADPHFSRVVRYFRSSDYLAWAGLTAAFPGALYALEIFDPTKQARNLAPPLRLGAFLGLCGGFLYAYQASSLRLWGWRENEVEQQRAQQEPEPSGAGSSLTPYMQGVSYRNSSFSQLKFGSMPWFNFSEHDYHKPKEE